MNKLLSTIFVIVVALTFSLPVFAEEFVLSHIGGLATQGKKFNQWWYEPQRVVLKGTGSRGANIDVTLNGKFNVVKASVDDGSWKFDAGTLEIADHNVIVASGDQSYSFILTVGSPKPADMSGDTKGGLPEAGGVLPLAGVAILASGLIIYSLKKERV